MGDISYINWKEDLQNMQNNTGNKPTPKIAFFPTSFGTLLAIAFIVLKLIHYIDWNWWWVLSPLWIPIAFWGAVVLLILIIQAFLK